MKKSLIALSIMSVLGMQAYAQTTLPADTSNKPMTSNMPSKDIPATTSLNKKVLKEGEKTQDALKDGKLMPGQAATLDKNEANIAKDLTNAKQDGKVTGDEKKYIKKEINNNQDMRDDMKKSTKEATKDMKATDKIMKDSKAPMVRDTPATSPAPMK
jgi:hypothetical protein